MDLLTTVVHELGNAMGFAEDTGQDVTGSILADGTRRLPPAQPTDAPAVTVPTASGVTRPSALGVPPGQITATLLYPSAPTVEINPLVPPVTFDAAVTTGTMTLAPTAKIDYARPAAWPGAGPDWTDPNSSVSTDRNTDGPTPIAGDISMGLVLGPSKDLIAGDDADALLGGAVAPHRATSLDTASQDELIRAIRDSDISITTVVSNTIADVGVSTWLFDETTGTLVAPRPAPLTIVIDGEVRLG
jgi:hypothetical protein